MPRTAFQLVDLAIHISHGQTNRPGIHTDDKGNYTVIRVEDTNSHLVILELQLSPTEFGDALAGRYTELEDAEFTRHADRVGWVREHTSYSFGIRYAYDAPEVAAKVEEYRAAGWTDVTVRRSNHGPVVHAERYVAPPAAEAEVAP